MWTVRVLDYAFLAVRGKIEWNHIGPPAGDICRVCVCACMRVCVCACVRVCVCACVIVIARAAGRSCFLRTRELPADTTLGSVIKPSLEEMLSHGDVDVEFFAAQALALAA
jgi:hypothetical protein